MLLRFTLLFCLCLLSFMVCGQSQSTQLIGKVLNHENDPVVDAIVKLKDQSTSKILHYQNTDSLGYFSMDNIRLQDYSLTVSHILYKPYQEQISLKPTANNITIKLSKDETIIDDVIVSTRGERLIRKGDTLIIKHSYYTIGTERNLRDVLKTIPGFRIEGENIYYQGKLINKVLLEDKDVFNYNKSIVLNSIIPEDIDNLQVIENYREKSEQLESAVSDNTALNVNLKDDALRLRGKVKAEAGVEGYSTENSAYNISPITSITFFLNSNSLAEPVISVTDLLNVNTSFGNLASNYKQLSNLISNEFSFGPSMKGNSHVAGGNVDWNLSNNVSMNSMFMAHYSNFKQLESVNRFQINNTLSNNFKKTSSRAYPFAQLKNKLQWMPNDRSVVELSTNLIGNKLSSEEVVEKNENDLERPRVDINNALEFVHQLNDTSLVMSLTAGHFLKNQTPEVQLLNQNEPLYSEILSSRKFNFLQQFHKSINASNFGFRIGGRESRWQWGFSPNISFSQLSVEDQIQQSGSTDLFNNAVDISQQAGSINQSSTFSLNELEIQLDNELRNEKVLLKQGDESKLKAWLPNYKIRYEFTPFERVWVGYKRQKTHQSLELFQPGIEIVAVDQLTMNNVLLNNKIDRHSYTVGYFRGTIDTPEFFNIIYNYSNESNPIVSQSEFFSDYSLVTYTNLKEKVTHSISSNISKDIKDVFRRSRLLLNARYSSERLSDELMRTQTTSNYSVRLNLYMKLGKMLSLSPSLTFDGSFGKDFKNNDIFFSRLQPKLSTSFQHEKIHIDASVSQLFSRSQLTDFNSDLLIDSFLSYKLNDQWQLISTVYNVANLSSNNQLQTITYEDTYYDIITSEARSGYIIAGIERTF